MESDGRWVSGGKTGRNAEKDDQGKLADQDPVALCPKPVDKRSPEKLESPGHYQDGEKADPVERHTGIAQCDGERRLHHASRRGLGSVKPAQQSENDVGRGPCAVFGYSSQVQHSCSANGLLQSKKLDYCIQGFRQCDPVRYFCDDTESGMTFHIQRRTLIQSQLESAASIGVDPADVASAQPVSGGLCKVFGIHAGLNLTVFDVIAGTALGEPVRSAPCLAIDILFNATGRGWISPPDGGEDLSIPYRRGMMYLTFAPHGATGRYDVPAGARFHGIDIRIGLDFLERLGWLGAFAVTRGHPHHVASCGACWIGALSLPERIAGQAKSLLDSSLLNENDLAMEARCLDIIDAAIACVSSPAPLPAPTNRDRRRIEAARDILLDDLSRTWTIAELARRCGLSEKRLKAGFQKEFGKPVYRYLQLARLTEAKRMLAETDRNVTEISLEVGYTSTSHFARVFLREFGVLPSAIKSETRNSSKTRRHLIQTAW